MQKEPYTYSAIVLSVVDGDTAKFSIRLKKTRMKNQDLSFHFYVENGWLCLHEIIRFDGINAPEKDTEEGKRSKAWLSEQLPIGSEVKIRTRPANKKEKYGRYLATVFNPANLTELAISSGHGVAWDGTGTRPT